MAMKVICSWCRGEGQDGFVGEKAPFDDPRETHSICLTHETAVRARWEARRQTTGGLVPSCQAYPKSCLLYELAGTLYPAAGERSLERLVSRSLS